MTDQNGIAPKLSSNPTKKELMDKYKELLFMYQEKASSKKDKKEESKEKDQQKLLLETNKYSQLSDVSTTIDQLRLITQQSLSELQKSIEEKFKELRGFDEAIASQQEKLKEYFDIENQSYALLALLKAQEEQKETFNEEMKKTKVQWEYEKELLLQSRKREEDEYHYQVLMKKRKDEEDATAKKKQSEAELIEREALIKEREEEIRVNQEEFTKLQEQVESFPDRLHQETEKTKQEITESVTKECEMRVVLINKEMESQQLVSENKIKHLQSVIESQKLQIHDLHEQLASTLKQIQEVTLKTIEGRTSDHALQAVNKIAMEQAKGGSQQMYNRKN